MGNRQWRVRKRGFRDEGAEGEVRGLVVVGDEVVSLGEWATEGSWERRDAMKARWDGSEVEVEVGGGIVIGGGKRLGCHYFAVHVHYLFPTRMNDPAAVHLNSTDQDRPEFFLLNCTFAIYGNYNAIRTSKVPYLAREYNACI